MQKETNTDKYVQKNYEPMLFQACFSCMYVICICMYCIYLDVCCC
jgi:hypothetical protein